jgi:hypothetical protein
MYATGAWMELGMLPADGRLTIDIVELSADADPRQEDEDRGPPGASEDISPGH